MARTATPLSSHRVLHTTSVDEARHSVGSSLAPHRLTPTRGTAGFRARHHAVALEAVSLHFIDYGCEVDVDTDGLAFGLVQIPLAGSTAVFSGARSVCVDPNRAVFTEPGSPLRMRYSTDNPRLMVRVPGDLLESRRARAAERGVSVPRRAGASVDLTRGVGRSWRALLEVVTIDLEDSQPLGSVSSAASSLQLALVDGLLACLVGPSASEPPSVRPAARRRVERAAGLLRERCEESWTTVGLAEEVGLTVRALQAGFRDRYECSPTAYLRRARLERVRLELRGGVAASVTDVAMRWGLTHLGRLSVDYRAAFGESPSETLRAARGW
ncbi:AraC family transcriptional regulator [Nocardioides acrostichi]|uniref:AraC family transcriptional regulator n=1 Tax=Nocardioides acrostichi TaxID=2784339 RepID=A0A930V0F3_9ACTN|nr:AraC family transcriptional regulator [Nocardioides acrostichi]MBF4161430.1 AraC family transcriptional regulator [Nocardioides acrostichi]